MRVLALGLSVLVLLAITGAGARDQPQATRLDPVAQTLSRLETVLSSSDRVGPPPGLISPQLPPTQLALVDDIRIGGPGGPRRAVVRERERRPAGGGYFVVADLLVSRGVTGHLARWEIELRPRASAINELEIIGLKRLAQLEGLIRFSLDTAQQFAVHNLVSRRPTSC
jgi:hypothetical protein